MDALPLNNIRREMKVNEDLIDLMNELQAKLSASGYDKTFPLPQIVVVGSQSVGKSSVLENIVGREFLPRGVGVVTRRPTVIQMHQIDGEEYAVFNHLPGKTFKEFSAIRQEITDETNRVPGKTGFSSIPIFLKIYSPRVLKLTVVDLPGLVKVAVDGQEESSVEEIREMVKNYISTEECLILAVTPANQDIANSDALEIAKDVDPYRERTIGVLTKIDLMDYGNNARGILENKVIPLQRGFVGVYNRSPKHMEEGKSIQWILEEEKKFFEKSSIYGDMSHKLGTPYLKKLLQRSLKAHIKKFLPKVRKEVSMSLSKYEKQHAAISKIVDEGLEGKQLIMVKLIHSFAEDMTIKLTGNSELVDSKNIDVGAQIHFKLYTEVQNKLKLTSKVEPEELTVLIANLGGVKGSFSTPSLAMDTMCRKLIEEYKRPMEDSVMSVADVLIEAIETSASSMDAYQDLKNEVLQIIGDYVLKKVEDTKERLNAHVDAEMNFINFGHKDFDPSVFVEESPPSYPLISWLTRNTDSLKLGKSAGSTVKDLKGLLVNNNSAQNKVNFLTTLIKEYQEIVSKQMMDVTLKYIVFFLVKKVLDFIRLDLIAHGMLRFTTSDMMRSDLDEDYRQKEYLRKKCADLREVLDTIQAF